MPGLGKKKTENQMRRKREYYSAKIVQALTFDNARMDFECVMGT